MQLTSFVRQQTDHDRSMSEVIEQAVLVSLGPAEAFKLFFEKLQRWWPREYTWGNEVMEAIGIEPGIGGLCFERGPHGFRCDWGRVLEWQPPHHVKLAWQIGPHREPVPDPAKASLVEVRFSPESTGGTRVTVRHSEFRRHGSDAARYQAALGSQQGWPYLLAQYAAAV